MNDLHAATPDHLRPLSPSLTPPSPTSDFSRVVTFKNLHRALRDRELSIHDTTLDAHLQINGMDHLPQARTLKDVLQAVQGPGLAEAYLRGSFSTGDADSYSDIDLFLVVDRDNLEETFLKFLEHAKSRYEILSICHDKLVADYGGVGFMALLKDPIGQRVTQFDLYFCMTGGQPATPLVKSPRVYSRDINYSVFCEKDVQVNDTNAAALMEHVITPLGAQDEIARHELNDLAIAAFIMSKHLTRGQYARARNDDAHAVQLCSRLLKDTLGYTSHQSPLYFGDRLAETCVTSGTPAQQKLGHILQRMFVTKPSYEQINNIVSYCDAMIADFYPNLENDFSPILNELRLSANPHHVSPNVFAIANEPR